MKKHIEKTICLIYSQSRRKNLRFEGLLKDDNETWDEMEAKVKNFLVEKLDFESAPEIERAHRTGRTERQAKMELQNRERSLVSLQVIKQRRQFSRRQGESNPKF